MDVTDAYTRSTLAVPPKGWNITSLSDLACEIVDCNHSTPTWTSSGVVVIRNQNIRDGKLDLTSASYTNEEHYLERVRRAKPSAGDLVITREAPMGQVCMIPPGPRCCLGQRMVLLKIAKASANSTYVLYALQGDSVQKFIQVAGGTGSTVANLRLPVIRALPIPVPNLREQRAIAAALSDMDALLDGLDRLISKKRDLKQAVMQQLLTGQTRLPGFHGKWEVKRLGNTAVLKARIGWQGLTSAEYLETGNYFLVTGTEFSNGYIDWNSCHYVDERRYMQDQYIQLRKHDVLVTKDGTIGKVAIVTELPKPATLNSGIFVIRPVAEAFHPEFFYYLLCSATFKEFLAQLSAGSTINHLYQKDFVSFTYEVPATIEEQAAIATVLSEMDAELAVLERRREKSRSLKQAMMQELLTGRTRLVKPEPVEPGAAYA